VLINCHRSADLIRPINRLLIIENQPGPVALGGKCSYWMVGNQIRPQWAYYSSCFRVRGSRASATRSQRTKAKAQRQTTRRCHRILLWKLGESMLGLWCCCHRIEADMHGFYTSETYASARVLSLRCLPKTIPHDRASHSTPPLGHCAYILDNRMVKGPLVRWSYIFSWRTNSEAKGDAQKRRENLPYMHPALISPRWYYTCQCLGRNWIWI
jgi:hypothetical protein